MECQIANFRDIQRQSSNKEFIKNDPQRIHVCPSIDISPPREVCLLRAHVFGCADRPMDA